ncbi:MAG: hypothetical protein AAF560_15410 [Acidobacteriota bacterium]
MSQKADHHGPDLEALRERLAKFPGHETLVSWVAGFRDEIKKLEYGAVSRWVKRQNEVSHERAEREGNDLYTVNRLRPDGHIDSQTTVPVAAEPHRVLAALREVTWSTWWRHSDTEVQEIDDAGRIRRFDIYPLGRGLAPNIKVTITFGEPRSETLEDGPGIVLPAKFRGDFHGDGKLEITELPNGSRLRIFWPNFEVTGSLSAFPGLAIVLHGNTLEGHPFSVVGNESSMHGTGFEGLRHYLEAETASGS